MLHNLKWLFDHGHQKLSAPKQLRSLLTFGVYVKYPFVSILKSIEFPTSVHKYTAGQLFEVTYYQMQLYINIQIYSNTFQTKTWYIFRDYV